MSDGRFPSNKILFCCLSTSSIDSEIARVSFISLKAVARTSSTTSGLLGQQPVSLNVKLVYKGLLELSPSFLKDVCTLDQVSHEQHTGSTLPPIAIALTITITCSRLLVRKFRSRAFGLDDMAIIPACFGCVVFLALG